MAKPASGVVTSMRTFEIVACSLAGGAVAAVLWRRARQRRPPNPPAVAALASSVSVAQPRSAGRHRSLERQARDSRSSG